MGKRILRRRRIDILDVHERQVTHPGRGWGGGEVMKREISREVIYRQLTAKVSGLKLCPSPWDQCLLQKSLLYCHFYSILFRIIPPLSQHFPLSER